MTAPSPKDSLIRVFDSFRALILWSALITGLVMLFLLGVDVLVVIHFIFLLLATVYQTFISFAGPSPKNFKLRAIVEGLLNLAVAGTVTTIIVALGIATQRARYQSYLSYRDDPYSTAFAIIAYVGLLFANVTLCKPLPNRINWF